MPARLRIPAPTILTDSLLEFDVIFRLSDGETVDPSFAEVPGLGADWRLVPLDPALRETAAGIAFTSAAGQLEIWLDDARIGARLAVDDLQDLAPGDYAFELRLLHAGGDPEAVLVGTQSVRTGLADLVGEASTEALPPPTGDWIGTILVIRGSDG